MGRNFPVGSSKKWKGTSYTPDFYLPKTNKWVEIKGLLDNRFKCKFRRFKRLYPDISIEILKGKDLKALGVLDIKGIASLSLEGRRNRKKHNRVLAKR